MNLSVYQSEIKKIINQRNGYLVLSMGLLLLCILITIFANFLNSREKIILVPSAMTKDMWVASSDASKEYYSKLTLTFSELALNVTPSNVDYIHSELLKFVDPAHYGAIKTQFVSEAERVKQQHISTTFFLDNIQVDAKNHTAVVTGDLKSYIVDTPLPVKRVSYRFVYDIRSYFPYIKSFEEIKNA